MNADQQPLVSVIIASYNHARYIEQSILSVLQQSYAHVELLVVDDGSTDGSAALIQRLQQAHGFDFRAQANHGLSQTLNEAISRSRGDLIAPFGSDDVMYPQRLEIQVRHMHGKPEVGICAGNIELIDEHGQVLSRQRKRAARRLGFDEVFLGNVPGAPAPTLLFRREALERVGGFDPSIRLEDLFIKLKITRAGYVIDVLEETLAQYRTHGQNTYKNRRFMVDNVLKTYAEFSDHPAYEKVCANFLNSMLLKCASDDKELAAELLAQLPWRHRNLKTLRALGRRLRLRL